MSRWLRILLVCAITSCSMVSGQCMAKLSEPAQKAVDKAVAYLISQKDLTSDLAGLVSYSLLKAGKSNTDQLVAELIRRVAIKTSSGSYIPRNGHYKIYEACTDLMALEAADPKKYKAEIQIILDLLLSEQEEKGGWYYSKGGGDNGDTSISQYVILALWAAHRSGFSVPAETWNKAAQWHIDTQRDDGGFAYHPPKNPDLQVKAKVTMTAAGCASLGIIRWVLFPNPTSREVVSKNQVAISGLQRVTQSGTKKIAQPTGQVDAVEKELSRAIGKSLTWLRNNESASMSRISNVTKNWQAYYAYTIERVGAVQQINEVAGENWYGSGMRFLLKTQQNDGRWEFVDKPVENTCFGVLFLVKATEKIVGKRKTVKSIAGGLQQGGRGFPDDLATVEMENGIAKKKQSLGEVDDLLTTLEKGISDVELAEVQKKLIQNVQLGNREKLIGQRERLVKLAAHPHVEVRRTAIWALARCAKLEDAKMFVSALKDESLDVAVEARNALCWLSRKPLGLGEKKHPFDELGESSTDDQKKQAVIEWRKDITNKWYRWYLQNRPYDLRDDLEEPPKKRQ